MTKTFYNMFYYEKNRDELRERRKIYYREKGEKLRAYRKQYYEETKIIKRQRNPKPRKPNVPKDVIKKRIIDIKDLEYDSNGFIVLKFP